MSSQRIHVLAVVVATALLAACQINSVPEELRYRDPELPLEEIAEIPMTGSTSFPNSVMLQFVDGKDIQRMRRWDPIVKVLPGNHEIRIAYRDGRFFRPEKYFWMSMSVNVEAGHRYMLHGSRADGLVRIWLEDVDSKAVIGVGSVFDASDN